MTSDPWCCIYDMGVYDLILYESESYQSVESYRQMAQSLHDKPLSIILRSSARCLIENWLQVDLCQGIRIAEPQKATSYQPSH